jgi:SAM-dependent methyltransferase
LDAVRAPAVMNGSRDPKAVVAEGYDRIAERYVAADRSRPSDVRGRYLAVAMAAAPTGAAALDLGCGTGELVTATLATRYAVVGIDTSPRSVALARAAVPTATFSVADIATVEFADRSFDLVAAFFSLIHLPSAEHAAVAAAIGRWLRPGGTLVATIAADEPGDSYAEDWLGTPMFWGSCAPADGIAAVTAAGLTVVSGVVEAEDGDAGPRHLWVVARKHVD